MQFVDPALKCKVRARNSTRQIINRASADTQFSRLPDNWKPMGTINHRFALSKPALVSAPSKKLVIGLDPRIIDQGQFFDLGMEHFEINGRRGGVSSLLRAENAGGGFREPHFSDVDLIGMHIKLLRKFRQGLFALDCGERHFSFESRGMVPAWSSCHNCSCSRQHTPLSNRNTTYRGCSEFPDHLCPVFQQGVNQQAAHCAACFSQKR